MIISKQMEGLRSWIKRFLDATHDYLLVIGCLNYTGGHTKRYFMGFRKKLEKG